MNLDLKQKECEECTSEVYIGHILGMGVVGEQRGNKGVCQALLI